MCVSCSTDYYVPTKRYDHSTHIVGDYLYMWGGDIDGLPLFLTHCKITTTIKIPIIIIKKVLLIIAAITPELSPNNRTDNY